MRLAHNEFVFGSAWLEVSTINAGCVHAFDKPIEVTGTSELQADEGGTSFPVVALEVFEEGDVVVGAENIAEEGPELAGFLGEIDEKVVLQAAVTERAPAGSAMMPSFWYSSIISVQTAPSDTTRG